ncbi:MAG: LytR C-terminal domain-containing protein [Acidimicrobiales bacterium]
MTEPEVSGQGPRGPVLRGVLLTALAVAVGIGVLSSISRIHTTNPVAAVSATSTTTTAAPASTTTTTLATHPPASVRVLVANGTSTPGAAGKLASKLNGDGYDTLAPTDTTSKASASAVYYAPGYQGDADAIASASGLTASAVQPLSSSVPVTVGSAEVVVIIGPDIAASV